MQSTRHFRSVCRFCINSLSVVDDMPREEFNPRQRHTLKEFVTSRSVLLPRHDFCTILTLTSQAIAMREMELWRDKVVLCWNNQGHDYNTFADPTPHSRPH